MYTLLKIHVTRAASP